MENATTKGEISIDDLPEYLKDKYRYFLSGFVIIISKIFKVYRI
ncbi:hypothetical protein [Marinitoga litoralis]|nr:hypothetical protein [Marinitoga litoralis]MBM7559758.1 hypothetical protein [Marinitoga litoralis]